MIVRLRSKTLLTVFLAAFASLSFARGSRLTGKIVAYDVVRHAQKAASATQNEEVVILETEGQKKKYVKVVVSTFGTTQIEQKYFDGASPLTLDVLRDRACDEKTPQFVTQVSSEQLAGTYLLTDAYKSHSPGRLKTLDCYDAIFKKKR